MVKLFERRRVTVACGVSLFLLLCILLTHQTNAIETLRSRLQQKEQPTKDPEEDADKYKRVERPTYVDAQRNDTATVQGKEKFAYVIFLSDNGSDDPNLENDLYVQAIRILVWQLKHKPETRTKHDVVVMVAPGVSESRRERLRKDGAIIYSVELLRAKDNWIKYDVPRWDEVLTKLRIWEMTQYDRILMLDGDSMLLKNLDGVFDDPNTKIMQTKGVNHTLLPGQPPLPETYLLASLSEVWDSSHAFPPREGTGLKNVGMFNAGFFMMAPSLEMFNYYKSFLDIPNSFNPQFPEQNLMNQVHEWSGPMPWREVDYKWNIRYPTEYDFANGLVSTHEKWWEQKYIYENQEVKDWLRAQRWVMQGWYDAMDLMRSG